MTTCKFCDQDVEVTLIPETRLAKCNSCGKVGKYIMSTMEIGSFLEEGGEEDKIRLLREACEAGLEDIERYGWWHKTQEIMRNALEITK